MAGLLSFLGFGKKEKPNLTQNYQAPPGAMESPMWGSLSQLAKQRIAGEGTGFGDDFTSRMSSPGIAQIDANFNNRTMPKLSSEASKRGLARSSIVQDQIGQADQARNRDIASMVANFQYLNEQQKKTDQQSGINLGSQLQSDFLNQGNQAASQFNAAEAGNTARTAGVAATNNQNSLNRQNQTIGALLGAATGGMAGGGMSGAFYGASQGFGGSGVGTLTLGDDEKAEFLAFYKKYKGIA